MARGAIIRRKRDCFLRLQTSQSAECNASRIFPASNTCNGEKLPANTFIVRILGPVHDAR